MSQESLPAAACKCYMLCSHKTSFIIQLKLLCNNVDYRHIITSGSVPFRSWPFRVFLHPLPLRGLLQWCLMRAWRRPLITGRPTWKTSCSINGHHTRLLCLSCPTTRMPAHAWRRHELASFPGRLPVARASHTWPLNPCQIAGRRPGTTPTSFTSKVDTVMKQLDYTYAFEFILIPRRQQLDGNSALTEIQHALTFDYSGVSLTVCKLL